MALIGGTVGYRMLRAIAPAEPRHMNGSAYERKSKLETLLGPEIWERARGKTVIDFGCGPGFEAIELAQNGARHVFGVDILERWLTDARTEAGRVGCDNVAFATQSPEPADIVISIDAFEHFADPASILETMAKLLKPEGFVLASFGPTWYHPLGGHLFSVFPWAHLIFSQTALCRWRAHFKTDGAQRFSEVEGGLNQMTIHRFERLVARSSLKLETLQLVPIRRLRALHNRWTREFFTAIVRCRLVPR